MSLVDTEIVRTCVEHIFHSDVAQQSTLSPGVTTLGKSRSEDNSVGL